MRATYLVLMLVVLACAPAMAQKAMLVRMQMTGGDAKCIDVPVCASIELPAWVSDVPPVDLAVWLNDSGDRQRSHGQLVVTGEGKGQLWWIVPEMRPNAADVWTARVYDFGYFRHGPGYGLFWDKPNGESLDLFGRTSEIERIAWTPSSHDYSRSIKAHGRVIRYMYGSDASTSQRLFETYKPFYHVYDGTQRLTNGPDGEQSYVAGQVLYPHHRGIFIGWNRLAFMGKRYDLWHMKGVAQVHQGFEEMTAGFALGKSTAVIHWNDPNGEPILVEKRCIMAYRVAEPTVTMIDIECELKAVRGDVLLDGDPEHAGVHYRAHNDVATGPKEGKARYLFHADGIDPRKDKDLPWVAMSYGLNGKRYCVHQMNHPANPKGTLYSAYRDYGRFGAFFKEMIKKGKTLTVRYRFWVGRGETPSREELAARYAAYANPPKVEVLEQQSTPERGLGR